MKWSVVAAGLAAAILSLTLLSGKALINFNHTPNFNQVMQDPTFKVVNENGIPAIYLSSSINKPDDYRNLIMYINNHKHVKDMYIYLSGNGGMVRTTLDLINTMKASPTKFHVKLYGDVYSGHAILAMNGDTLDSANPNILLLFHIPAVSLDKGKTYITVPEYCKTKKGKDRGISQKDKCIEMNKQTSESMDKIAMPLIYSVMTESERKRYFSGDDIILSYAEIKKRLNKKFGGV